MDLSGKVAIVTGSGRGLGLAYASELARAGAAVVVNDVDEDPAKEVVDAIVSAGGAAVLNADNTVDPAAADRLIGQAVSEFGKLDVLVNNAGITRDKTFHNMTAELVDPVLDVHLRGAFWVTRPAWVKMREQGYGRVINTSSNSGILGNFGQSNYGAAKMGLVGFTRVLAQEGAKYNIKANAIAPVARTRMTEDLLGPLVEKIDPGLVSPVVAYLVSEDVPVTGEVYSVGGGRVSRIFIAEAPGFFKKDLTVEDVRDNFDQIRSEADYLIPTSANMEIAMLLPFLSDEGK